MKKILDIVKLSRLSLISTLLFCFVPTIISCGPTKEETILEGKWEGVVTETDEDGSEMTYRIVMDFNYENDVLLLTVAYSVPELGEFVEMSVTGGWMASEDEITFFVDEESTEVRFTAQTKLAASIFGVSLDDFEEYCSTMVRQQFGIWDDIKVYSISEKSLTIDFDGSRLKLHKRL